MYTRVFTEEREKDETRSEIAAMAREELQRAFRNGSLANYAHFTRSTPLTALFYPRDPRDLGALSAGADEGQVRCAPLLADAVIDGKNTRQ